MAADDHERVEVASREELRRWLEQNHTQTASIWLVTWKKAAGTKYLPYDDIVEEALCFGWVDSLPRALDDKRSMRRLSPRQKGSGWSAVNKRRIAKLEKAGLMTEAGRRAVRQAKADGSWNALDEAEKGVIPDDLAAALKKNGKAAAHFDAFPPSVKKGILGWIGQAKRPETREKRIRQTAEMAAGNKRAMFES